MYKEYFRLIFKFFKCKKNVEVELNYCLVICNVDFTFEIIFWEENIVFRVQILFLYQTYVFPLCKQFEIESKARKSII